MSTIRCQISIDRPAEAVFAYFANPDQHVAGANPGVEGVERLSPGPTAPGSVFRFRRSTGLVREATSRFTVVEPPRELQAEGVVGALRPWSRLTFEPLGDSTTVHFAGEANPTGPMKLLGPIASRVGQKVWAERLAAAKAFLENGS